MGCPYNEFLSAPQHWYVQIKGLYRDFTESRSQGDLEQKFCLIITISDNKKASNIYQTVSGLLDSRNFINENIRIRTEVEVSQPG